MQETSQRAVKLCCASAAGLLEGLGKQQPVEAREVAGPQVQALVRKMRGAQERRWSLWKAAVGAAGCLGWSCLLMWNSEVLWVTGSQRKGSAH